MERRCDSCQSDVHYQGTAVRRLLVTRLPPHRLVQVYCTATEDLLMQRYLARDRHPGHHDALRADEVRAAIRGDVIRRSP